MNIPTSTLLASIVMAIIKGMQHSKDPHIADLGDNLFNIIMTIVVIGLLVFFIITQIF